MPDDRLEIRVTTKKVSGFTLVEVLVVLIMFAMISTVLFQFLDRVYKLQRGIGVEQFNATRKSMSLDWFRQSVHGLLPDQEKGVNKFTGTRNAFSGLTNNPLSEEYGSATATNWKLSFDSQTGNSQLIYSDTRGKSVISAWRGGEAQFVYLDDQMEPHQSWPPELGKWPQFPKLIMLEVSRIDPPLVIIATPMSSYAPPIGLQDIFGQFK